MLDHIELMYNYTREPRYSIMLSKRRHCIRPSDPIHSTHVVAKCSDEAPVWRRCVLLYHRRSDARAYAPICLPFRMIITMPVGGDPILVLHGTIQ